MNGGKSRDQGHHHQIGGARQVQAVAIDQDHAGRPNQQVKKGCRPTSPESPVPQPGTDQGDQRETGTDAQSEEQASGNGGSQRIEVLRHPGVRDSQVAAAHHCLGGLQQVQIGQVDMGGGDDLSAQQTDDKHGRGIQAAFHFVLDTLAESVVLTKTVWIGAFRYMIDSRQSCLPISAALPRINNGRRLK